jgi:hypothetical protein
LQSRLLFLICIDADPDRPEHGGERYDCPDRLGWKKLPELVSKFSELRQNIANRWNAELRFNWFLRSDLQIKMIHGDAASSLRKLEPLWKTLREQGDELGWHPHAWRWSDARGCWYNEITDFEFISKSLEIGFEGFKDAIGVSPESCRAGISFHNNDTMAKLDDLGVKTDLSANPGLRLFYARPAAGNPIMEGSDWGMTGVEPYYPSRSDYQRPASSGEIPLKLLEIPLTTWRKTLRSFSFWKGLMPIQISKLRFRRPIAKGWFVPSLWTDPSRFELAFDEVLRRSFVKGIAHFATSLHPDDVDEGNYRRVTASLDYALTKARDRGVNLEFVTAKQALKAFSRLEF